MQEIVIRILGRDNNQVGDHLEILAKELLAKLGFGSFIRNAYRTGAEIDLKARHRVTDAPLMCECKARSDRMSTPAVKLFYAEWEKERKTDNRTHGMIISTSSYSGTAEEWYNELDAQTKRGFTLLHPSELLALLISADLALDPQAISVILDQRHSMGQPHDYWLTYSQHGIAWISIYYVEGRPSLYTISDGKGRPLPRWKCQEIASLSGGELLGLEFFGLDLRKKVQLEVLEEEGSSIQVISEATEESEADVRIALNALVNEGKLESRFVEGLEGFWFVRDIVPFVNVAKDFLKSENTVLFLSSGYCRYMLTPTMVGAYVDSRYNLGMKPHEIETLMQLLSISPTALWYALFDKTDMYIRFCQEIPEKIKDPDEQERWYERHRTSLIQGLVPHVARDMISKEVPLASHLAKLGIQRWRVKAGIDAVGANWKKLSVSGVIMAAIERAGGTIPAGSIVSSTNPINSLMLNGLLFSEVGEYDQAIEYLLQALELCQEADVDIGLHQAVLNNIAQAHMAQEKWEKAISYLDEAFELGEPEHSQLLTNKAICLGKCGKRQEAEEVLEQTEVLFPEISEDAHFIEVRKHIEIEGTNVDEV